ncbi:MAG: MotA/TolQ/ExbB proton channel family protein [Gammaproteobacteria bacterium]|nr:MotA/TolQ/ExbB proton channel family protein [Gammaproteobacteria bacterium]
MNYLYAYWSQSSGISQCIILILATLSVVSWTVIIEKWLYLAKFNHQASKLQKFQELKSTPIAEEYLHQHCYFFWQVLKLVQKNRGINHQVIPLVALLESQQTMVLTHYVMKLQKGLTVLTSIAHSAPYWGLLGTVVSILQIFNQLELAVDSQLSMMARPLGEALLLTALGLLVTIPAATAQHWVMRQNQQFHWAMSHFLGQFGEPAAIIQ